MNAFRAEVLLARTLFGRMFESELMPPGLPQVRIVIWGIAALTAPGYMMSWGLAIRYSEMARSSASGLSRAIVLDQLVFIIFSMLALGGVALIVWEGVFPDRRDARILGSLPLSTRTHVLARLGALSVVAAIFCLGVNLPSALTYGTVIWLYGAAADPVRGVLAHIVATTGAGVLVFFLLIALQGLLLNVFGRQAAQRLALLLQAVFVVVLVQIFLFLPILRSTVSVALQTSDGSTLALLPPVWFIALYNVIAGGTRAMSSLYAVAGLAASGLSVALATALLAGSYRRLTRMALESIETRTSRGRLVRRLSAGMAGVLTPDPVQRAVAEYTFRTMTRSRTHLMLLATYLGIAAALITSTLIPLVATKGIALFAAPTVALLSAPLVLYFFGLCGLRVIFGLPTEIKANWTFRLNLSDQEMIAAVKGVRIALLISVVVPIACAAAGVGITLWGVKTGVLHGVFTGALGVLLVDLLLIGLRKVPFTCTYYPGRARARTLFPLYAMAFSLYAYSTARLEAAILTRPLLVIAFVCAVAVVVTGLARLRRRVLQPPPGLTYEEDDPDRLFAGFGLSESLAANAAGRGALLR